MADLVGQLAKVCTDLKSLGKDRDYESQTMGDFFSGIGGSTFDRLPNLTTSSRP